MGRGQDLCSVCMLSPGQSHEENVVNRSLSIVHVVWLWVWMVVCSYMSALWLTDLNCTPPSPSISWDRLQPPPPSPARDPEKDKQFQMTDGCFMIWSSLAIPAQVNHPSMWWFSAPVGLLVVKEYPRSELGEKVKGSSQRVGGVCRQVGSFKEYLLLLHRLSFDLKSELCQQHSRAASSTLCLKMKL